MAPQSTRRTATAPHDIEEPKRTPGQAEGTDNPDEPTGNPDLRGPLAAEWHTRTQEEPGRTPGNAEG